jgi:transposase
VEAKQDRRDQYIEEIKDIDRDMIVYIDESGIELTICKDRGWGKKSQLLYGKKSGKYYQRTNIVAGLVHNRQIAPAVFNGSCNTAFFEAWVEEFLIKELKTGQVIVMDNATFHKSQRTKELIEAAGCKLIFLPPYSPDLNPIEKFWANMKRWIRRNISASQGLQLTINSFFSIG